MLRKGVIFFILFCCIHSAFTQDLSQIRKARPFEMHGQLSLQRLIYRMQGAPDRVPGSYYFLSCNSVISIYGFSLPFSFISGNGQQEFRQPLNQIGFSPQYKWLKLHAGYRSISFSQFGMAGHIIFGGGVEMNPGKFRFTALFGRSNKAVPEDTSKTIVNNLNSINYPSYRQMLMAVKLGWGTQHNFVDLYCVKGRDDEKSLPAKPTQAEVLPGENLVLGIMHKFSFFKNKVEWQSELASSIFTRDVTLPGYDLSNIPYNKVINKIMTPNVSTVLYTAMESQLKYRHRLYTIGGKYRRVEPDYKSMGAYFFQTDLEQITANLNTRLLNNKVNLNGSAGIQKDNVVEKKLATTQRNIYSLNINYHVSKNLGIDLNYSNYGTAQKPGTKSLSDTSRINQISNSITVSPHYFLLEEDKRSHNFFFIAGKQNLHDRNIHTSNYTEMEMLFSNFNYSLGLLASKWTYNGGLNYSRNFSNYSLLELYGANAGIGKTLVNDKMNLDLNMAYNNTRYKGLSNGYVYNFYFNYGYQINKLNNIKMQISYLINRSANEEAGKSFKEFSLQAQYILTF